MSASPLIGTPQLEDPCGAQQLAAGDAARRARLEVLHLNRTLETVFEERVRRPELHVARIAVGTPIEGSPV